MCVAVPVKAPQPLEPDDYAYRASIVAPRRAPSAGQGPAPGSRSNGAPTVPKKTAPAANTVTVARLRWLTLGFVRPRSVFHFLRLFLVCRAHRHSNSRLNR